MTADLLIFHSSYIITLIALAVREILWLRIILTVSQCGHLVHSYINLDLNKGVWIFIFIFINIIQIIIIYRDRREVIIPEQIKDLYEKIFKTMTNREFVNFWDLGKPSLVESKKIIITGETQKDLILILNGKADVLRDGKNIAKLGRGQFIAEISYITGKPASADVIPREGLTYYLWNRDNLETFRKSKPGTMGKLDRILSLDMAAKLTK